MLDRQVRQKLNIKSHAGQKEDNQTHLIHACAFSLFNINKGKTRKQKHVMKLFGVSAFTFFSFRSVKIKRLKGTNGKTLNDKSRLH